MARETVGTDSRLQFELVKALAQANDTKEALRWAREYKMPKEQWPWALIDCEEPESEGPSGVIRILLNNSFLCQLLSKVA